MGRKEGNPEEEARRAKIRELLELSQVSSMDDIQKLFKETIGEFMEDGLDAELSEELGYSKYDYRNKETGNSRNGHSSKTLRTSFGKVDVSVPRDRKGEFEPQLLKKNQTSISQDIEEKILVRQGHDDWEYRGAHSGHLRRGSFQHYGKPDHGQDSASSEGMAAATAGEHLCGGIS